MTFAAGAGNDDYTDCQSNRSNPLSVRKVKAASPSVLTVNGGSSSIKFALFDTGSKLERTLTGRIEGIGLARARFSVKGRESSDSFSVYAAPYIERAILNAIAGESHADK